MPKGSGAPSICLEDGQGLVGNRFFAVRRAVGEEIFAGVRIRSACRVGIGDHVRDGLGDAGEALPVEIMRARLISRAQGRAKTVRQLHEIAVGDEGVAQSLLLLFRERQQRGLANGAGLDAAGDGEVRAQSRHSVCGVGEGGDGSQALESGHVGHALRVGRGGAHHKGQKADSASQSGHGAPPATRRQGFSPDSYASSRQPAPRARKANSVSDSKRSEIRPKPASITPELPAASICSCQLG